MKANDVIMIGAKRRRAASTAASPMSLPGLWRWSVLMGDGVQVVNLVGPGARTPRPPRVTTADDQPDVAC
jgi:hypothetical protein